MGIRIILWDIDRTILDFDAAQTVAIRTGFQRLGLGECTDEMLDTYDRINHKYWQMLEKGNLDKEEVLIQRFIEFFETFDLDVSKARQFHHNYQTDLGDTIVFLDDADKIVKDLSANYKQYIVTNGTAEAQNKKLKTSGLKDIVDGYFISDEIGIEKPKKEYFDWVFKKIKEDIGEFSLDDVIIIGDSLTSDIRGGNNAGIKTIWYNRRNDTNDIGVQVDYEIKHLSEIYDIIA